MKRRWLMTSALALPAAARAQAPTVRRLAIVSPGEPLSIMSESGGNAYYRVLFEDLRKLGWIEGRTLAIARYGRERALENGIEAMIA